MNDLMKVAREEEQRLLRKLESVRALIRAYDETPVPTAIMPVAMAERAPRRGSTAAQVIRVADEFLSRLDRRASSTEITEEVLRHGVELKGQKPAAMVASYLSSSDRFDNVKGEGYGLTKWGQQQSVPPTGSRDEEDGGVTPIRKMEAATPNMEIAA